MHIYQNFTQAYYGLLRDVFENPDFTSSPRGMKIKEKLGVRFEIKNPRDRLPFIEARNFSVSYVIAEGLWYFAGLDSTEWISKYSSFWSKISDDGKTANSAYGARIFRPHSRIASNVDPHQSQWEHVINELVSDNDSRRAVIHIRSPQDTVLAKKDVPCTLTLQFFLRNDNLYQVVSMRSSDLILGIGNDIPAFTLFQEALALELSKRLKRTIGLGSYVHISNSLHLYERNFDLTSQILKDEQFKRRSLCPMPSMPSLPPSDILLTAEDSIAQTDNANLLRKKIELYVDHIGLDPYWADWVRLLGAHRAVKLGAHELQREFISETAYEGYQFFMR